MWLKNLWDQKLWNKIYYIISGLFTICGISFLLYHIWMYPNLYAIDFWGQIASAELYINYGFHGWSMQRFQGIINNLFYPPLQDSIVAFIHTITGLNTIFSFLLYTSLLLVWYFWSTWLISLQFKYTGSKIVYFLGAYIFFMINKFPNIWYMQGLWIVDILFTGLISQILWGLFLQLTVYEILSKKRIYLLCIYSILWFLSHLVIWPITILLTIIFILLYKRQLFIQYLLVIISTTTFFWLPFLWYKWLMASTTIFDQIPPIIAVISLIGIYFSRKNIVLLSIALTSVIILLPTEIFYIWQFFNIKTFLPNFHYYRLTSGACILLLVVIGGLSDIIFTYFNTQNKKNKVFFTSIFYIAVLGISFFGIYKTLRWFWEPMQQALWKPNIPTKQDIQYLSWLNLNYKIFTIDKKRPVDFSIDSLDQYIGHKNLYFKWLFWESSYTNQLVSSYISNILSPKNSVLYHYNMWDTWYETYATLWNKFIENYWIWYILVAPLDEITYLSDTKRTYLWEILQKWTNEFTAQVLWPVELNNTNYTLYKIIISKNSPLQNTIVSIVKTNPNKIVINSDEQIFSSTIIKNHYNTLKNTPYKPDIIYNTWSQDISFTYNSWDTNIEKLDTFTYKITTTSEGLSWLHVKINPLPWIIFYDEQKKTLPAITLPYGRYVPTEWSKIIYMTYKKPLILYVGYIISVLSILYIGYYYGLKKYLKR